MVGQSCKELLDRTNKEGEKHWPLDDGTWAENLAVLDSGCESFEYVLKSSDKISLDEMEKVDDFMCDSVFEINEGGIKLIAFHLKF